MALGIALLTPRGDDEDSDEYADDESASGHDELLATALKKSMAALEEGDDKKAVEFFCAAVEMAKHKSMMGGY